MPNVDFALFRRSFDGDFKILFFDDLEDFRCSQHLIRSKNADNPLKLFSLRPQATLNYLYLELPTRIMCPLSKMLLRSGVSERRSDEPRNINRKLFWFVEAK